MAKESKMKVKVKGHSSPKYISSDDSDEAFNLSKNPTIAIWAHETNKFER
jgi:hypothetical protein